MLIKKKIIWIVFFTVLVGFAYVLFYTMNKSQTQSILENNETVHDDICRYIETHIFSDWSRPDFFTICEYRLLDFDNQYIYIYAKGEDFQRDKTDNKILFRTNACLAPVRLTYKLQGDTLVITDAITPQEGAFYSEQLVQLFPSTVRDGMYNNEKNSMLEELVIKRAFRIFEIPYNPTNCRTD